MSPVASLPSLRETVVVAFRHKWLLAFATLLPVAICLAAAYLLTPTYEAYSRVLVRPGREYMAQTVPGSIPAAPQTSMREVVEAEIQILTSADLLRDVLAAEGIARLYPDLAASVQEPETRMQALRRLGADLVITPARRTNVIGIGLRNRDPAVAVGALETLLERFHEHHLRAFRRQGGSALEGKLAELERELDEARAARAEYVAARGLFSLGEQRDLIVHRQAANAEALREMERQSTALEAQIRHLRAELDREPASIPLQVTTQESTLGDEARRRLTELREREGELLATLGTQHPSVRTVRAQIAAAEQAVARARAQTTAMVTGINPLATTLRTALATAETERTPLQGRMAALREAMASDEARLQRLNADEVALQRLDSSIADLSAAVTVTHQRLTDARVSDAMDRANLASLQVIEQPTAFDKPIFPRKTIFAAAGGIVGITSGTLALLLVLTFGKRFLCEETIERMLGAPVLATLPNLGNRRLGRPAARLAGPAPRLGHSA